ncbi:MAG TPA: crosslink repair DNA glycosylase YcaQ family protein [Pilimelia sp.]|nr:crosslink repair DNA glycosylase YcaQ family protein [Pilimelia sp.]
MKLTADRVLAWRMRRQLLHRPPDTDAVAVVRRLCGVQAQVASCAEDAVAARSARPRRGALAERLAERSLVKTWAMRGTLHVLPTEEAAAYLALVAAARTWEKGSWQRAFVTAAQLAAITEAAREALDGAVLTREELTDRIIAATGDDTIAGHLRSGWGAVLKPLAWQGHLVHGPGDGNRVTFTSPATWLPGWRGLPEPDEAARTVIPAYLGAFGPASAAAFDQWLTRGASRRAALRSWFAALERAGTLTAVEVDGEPAYARTEDLDDLAASRRSAEVRLLPAFDQYVLGPGTGNALIIAPHRRAAVSRAAGWISPVVVAGGRVVGTWAVDGGSLDVTLFAEAGRVSGTGIEAEAARLAAVRGEPLAVRVRTD